VPIWKCLKSLANWSKEPIKCLIVWQKTTAAAWKRRKENQRSQSRKLCREPWSNKLKSKVGWNSHCKRTTLSSIQICFLNLRRIIPLCRGRVKVSIWLSRLWLRIHNCRVIRRWRAHRQLWIWEDSSQLSQLRLSRLQTRLGKAYLPQKKNTLRSSTPPSLIALHSNSKIVILLPGLNMKISLLVSPNLVAINGNRGSPSSNLSLSANARSFFCAKSKMRRPWWSSNSRNLFSLVG